MHIVQLGNQPETQFIWAHGWMQSHSTLLPLAQSLEKIGSHFLLDLPGFGASAAPNNVWSSKDYADDAAAWLKTLPSGKRIWIGHSFGCRVGIQLAANYPELIDGLFLVAAAGLPKQRTLLQQIKFKTRIYTYKGLKKLIPLGLNEDWLRNKFNSPDFQNAGDLRPIFLKIIAENLTEVAQQVHCPVHLIYGANDTQTPPDIGRRYAKLMPKAVFSLLPGYDHYTILTEGMHQVSHQLREFSTSIR